MDDVKQAPSAGFVIDVSSALKKLSKLSLETLASDLDNASEWLVRVKELQDVVSGLQATVAEGRVVLAKVQAQTAAENSKLQALKDEQQKITADTQKLRGELAVLKQKLGALLES